MSFAFLAPLMLAGAALLGAPYLIHRIRRPEREPVRFSSLLFIPDVKKEVIERRRLQHILLMLTRMAILLLIALAFARPYAKAAIVNESRSSLAKHVILIDTSFSMEAADRLPAAIREAERLLNTFSAAEEVAVAAFGDGVEVLAPFGSEANPEGGTTTAARAALRTIAATESATDYAAALREAQRLLLSEGANSGDAETRRIVHLISDLQRTGMPGPSETWKLSPSIELSAIGVGGEAPANLAVSEAIARRTSSNQIRVVAKVKNWSTEDADIVPLKLVVDGKDLESISKPVRAGNATQFSFLAPAPESGVLAGHLELARDGINPDNRRYFAWSPPAKHEVVILALPEQGARDALKPETWPASWFVQRALPTGDEWPFTAKSADPAEFRAALDGPGPKPSTVIVSGTDGVDVAVLDAVRKFVSEGGAALVMLDSVDGTAKEFAGSLGLDVRGLRFETASPAKYEVLTWVGFDHSIFVGFQGHLYNDFSSLRFHQYVELDAPAAEAVNVLARFESGAPAFVEARVGEGAVIVWPFRAGLASTNLPKTSRFVPLLFETMRYLCRVEESESAWHVGDQLGDRELVFGANGRSRVTTPGSAEREVAAGEPVPLERAGLAVTAGTGERRVYAVNVAARESDPTAIDAAELELKLASSPRVLEGAQNAGAAQTEEASIAQEYGILLLALVVAGLAFESWYMARLTAQKRTD